MVRLLRYLLPLAVAAFLLAQLLSSPETAQDDGPVTTADGAEEVEAAGLSGSGRTVVEPIVDASAPWKELADGFSDWPKGPSGLALVERAKTDAALIEELVDALHSKHDEARRLERMPRLPDVMSALMWIGAPSAGPLGHALHGGDEEWTLRAATCLRGLGADAAGALADVIRLVKDEERKVPLRAYLIGLLGEIGPQAAEISPLLHDMLRSHETDIEFDDVLPTALWQIEGDTKAVRETFTRILEDGSLRTCRALVKAMELSKGGISGLLRPLRLLLDGPRDSFTLSAIFALAFVRDEQDEALTLLEQMLRVEQDDRDTNWIVHSMAASGPAGWKRLSALTGTLGKELDALIFLQLTEANASAEVLVPLMGRFLDGDDLHLRAESLGHAAKMSLAPDFVKRHIVPHVAHEEEQWATLALAALFTCQDPDDEIVAVLDKRLETLSDNGRSGIRGEVHPNKIRSDRMWARFLRMIRSAPHGWGATDPILAMGDAEGATRTRNIKALIEFVREGRSLEAVAAAKALAGYGAAALGALPVIKARLAKAETEPVDGDVMNVLRGVLVDWRRAGVY